MGTRKTGLTPPPSNFILTVPRRFFCFGSLLLLVLALRIILWFSYYVSDIYIVNFRELNDHLFGKELFVRFTAGIFRKLPSVCVFGCFPFGFEGRMWNLIVSVPNHCLSFTLGSGMTTCLGKSCLFCIPRVPFVNGCQCMYLVLSVLVLRAGYGFRLYRCLIVAYLFTFLCLKVCYKSI